MADRSIHHLRCDDQEIEGNCKIRYQGHQRRVRSRAGVLHEISGDYAQQFIPRQPLILCHCPTPFFRPSSLWLHAICGIPLPAGLKECEQLPEPLYTPSTKAELGDHDENISFEQSVEVLEKKFPGHGQKYAETIRDASIALYRACAEYALKKGIIIADTKFEFGLDENGNVVIGDELLTPDSSRFWPLDGYEPGKSQPSYDKQFVRDWLKANPDSGYTLPQEVIDRTIAKYEEAYALLTGEKL